MIRMIDPFVHLAVRACSSVALGLLLVTSPATAQAPASSQPKAGGTLRIGLWSEPAMLNPYFSGTTGAKFSELTLDGLTRFAPDGSYVPELAAEIPTQANGDVSPDGTVVTWKLEQGVTWSDGQPFTSRF
jgi:peptide/nickel transport system substrate-binding protein